MRIKAKGLILWLVVLFALSLLFSAFLAAKENTQDIPPDARVLEATVTAEGVASDNLPFSIQKEIEEGKVEYYPPGLKLLEIKKMLIPYPPSRKKDTTPTGSQSSVTLSSSSSLGFWQAGSCQWEFSGLPAWCDAFPVSDSMAVYVTDHGISVTRGPIGLPKEPGATLEMLWIFTNGNITYSFEWRYEVLSTESAILYGNGEIKYTGPPLDYLYPTNVALIYPFASYSEKTIENYVIGTYTATENSPLFNGEIGRYDLRMMMIDNFKVNPSCFNPEGKDDEAKNIPRYFTNITGDFLALPVSTELFPDGWKPQDKIRWRILITTSYLLPVKIYEASSDVSDPDANGKVGKIEIDVKGEKMLVQWVGSLEISQEKAPAGDYFVLARAIGTTNASTKSNTLARLKWDDVKVTLHVPYFNQARRIDPAWGNDMYNGYPPGTSEKTFGEQGCAVTSAAMVLKYYGINTSPDGNPTNPGTLNEWLTANDGFVKEYENGKLTYAAIDWDKALNAYSKIYSARYGGPIVVKGPDIEGNVGDIDLQLGTETPPILRVRPRSHFVVATGKCEDTWTINDPAYWSSRLYPDWEYPHHTLTLNEWGNGYLFGITTKKQGALTGYNTITIYLGTSGHLLLTDPLGRRTGYDPVTKQKIKEIPDSSYHFNVRHDEHIFTGEKPPPPPPPLRELHVALSAPIGVYTLQVIGIEQEEATLWIRTYTLEEDSSIEKQIMLSPGTILRYKINFQGNGIPTEVTEVTAITIPDIKQKVESAFKANQIDNQGLMTSLIKKLEASEAALEREQIDVVKNTLNAFMLEVKAQKGKHILEQIADSLIRDTEEFISQLPRE